MGTALVTGASAGLGREFAVQLAERGHDLVLVARDRRRLAEVAGPLRERHGIGVELLVADLADRDPLEQVARRVSAADRPVDLLVNNAGFGQAARLLDQEVALEERALEVMARAVLVLSHAAARAMRERGHGGILNVSSVAGYGALGHYSAVKSWVTVFTESLGAELSSSGVLVTALCPGLVRTEFHERAGMDVASLPALAWLGADDVVRQALADLAAGRRVSIPSLRYRLVTALMRHAPRGLTVRASRMTPHRR